MKISDLVLPPASGLIRPYLLSKINGQRLVFAPDVLLAQRPNVVTYSAADLLARALAGDSTYLPRHIGFIYGTDPNPNTLDDPEDIGADLKRMHDWSKIASDVANIPGGGNMLVAPLALAPSLSLDGDAAKYAANAVTFSAHTGLALEYAFPTNGTSYAKSLPDIEAEEYGAVYVYHAVLLNRWQSGPRIGYTPFSRAAIESAPFTAKPASFDLGVFWTITFK